MLRRLLLIGSICLALGCATALIAQEPPAQTAAADAPHGVLEFSVRDPSGKALAARLSFRCEEGPDANLFPNVGACPDTLAVRGSTVYTLTGEGAFTVPVGSYKVLATHGLEWSIDETEITVTAGETVRWDAVIRHEINTSGWVSADFHLHTLTFSGHGDANPNERLISIIGEGVEVAVATDHNHNTDYAPFLADLGATGRVMPIVGNEISTPLGHFNAFPLDPAAPIFPPQMNVGQELFRLIRAHDSKVGVRTVIQVNHPRWTDIDYFGEVGLDPVTATTDSPRWSNGFDSVEIFNENAGWGYYEAGIDPIETGSSKHSVLEDWFNLLGRGVRTAAVGNSDSHTVIAGVAGYPRNFLSVPSDDIAELDVGHIARAIRAQQVFTTFGPFVEFTVDGAPMGSNLIAEGGSVELAVIVQAASWVDCDRVIVVVNGDRVREIPVPDTRTPLRLFTTVEIPIDRDCTLLLLVEGDDSLDPVVTGKLRPTLPLAVTNPVWIEGNGDTRWDAPAVAAEHALAAIGDDGDALAARWDSSPPSARKWLVAAADPSDPLGRELARDLAARGLADPVRRVRIAACSLIDRLDDPALDPAVLAIVTDDACDAYLRLCALRAVNDPDLRRRELLAWLDREGPSELLEDEGRWADELPGDFVRRWRVAGYFPVPAAGEAAPGPEAEGELDRRFVGRGGDVGWEIRETWSSGYLDLLGLHDDPTFAEHALSYGEVWVRSASERSVPFTLGTDDGCVFRCNGETLVVDTGSHGASPVAHFGRLKLREGWNRLLLRVENGRGGHGAYLRILDDAVTIAPRPDAPETGAVQLRIGADLAAIETAASLFRADRGRWPESLAELTEGWAEKYLSHAPNDPWNRPYSYRVDDSGPVVSCLGADGAEGGVGDDADTVTRP